MENQKLKRQRNEWEQHSNKPPKLYIRKEGLFYALQMGMNYW